jgi:hypothetical protein
MKAMSKDDLIKKIVDIDFRLNKDLQERKMTPEQRARLHAKRDSLERKLYK